MSTMDDKFQERFDGFQRDVVDHAVTVLRDDGLYRHLRCSRGGSYIQSFDVVTWPGYLCYSGDMGCFVFTRLRDMFEFFRGRRTAAIDLGYLSEKAVASDKHDGIREYSEELFLAAVKADFDEFVEAEALEKERADALWQLIRDDVLSRGDNRHDAVSAAMDFRWSSDGYARGRAVFYDFYEHRLDDYTGRFWWCCYAVPWAIERYDAQKATPIASEKEEADQVSGSPGKTSHALHD